MRHPQHPAQRLFGEPDYLLRVITADLPALQELYENASPPSRHPAPQLTAAKPAEPRRNPSEARGSKTTTVCVVSHRPMGAALSQTANGLRDKVKATRPVNRVQGA